MKAIRFHNVSKQYVIGKHVTLKRKMGDAVDRLLGRAAGNGATDVIWALKNVSFEVQQGETMGLIGPNGSGKSTTLKLLAKITEPDEGKVEIEGMVVPLIEVGAGFHQDLTGRENIYLNGSILGLKKADVDRHLDSIIEFAEIPQFIDTPLKKYSSGMSVRLGFAIAVHINPDVLLVDEVLAVGDVRFQRKCIAKMRQIVNSGRTVVFVSHNMAAVQSLCKRCILLFNGKVAGCGESQNVVNSYLTNAYNRSTSSRESSAPRGSACSFVKVECQDGAGNPVRSVAHGHDLILVVEFLIEQKLENACVFVALHNAEGATLFESSTGRQEKTLNLSPGAHRLRVLFKKVALLSGVYSFSVSLSDVNNTVFYGYAPNVVDFEVTNDNPLAPVGVVNLPTEWEMPPVDRR